MGRAIGLLAFFFISPAAVTAALPQVALSAQNDRGSIARDGGRGEAAKVTSERTLGDRKVAKARVGVSGPGESDLFQFLRGPGGEPGTLVQALDRPSARLQFAAADSILRILERSPTFYFPHEQRVIEVLTRALGPETIPTVILINSSGARPAEFESVMRQLGYETVVCSTGKDAFRYAASLDSVSFVVAEPVMIDYDLRNTVVNFNADSRTKDIPFFVFTLSPTIYLPIRNFWVYGGPNLTILPMTPDEEMIYVITRVQANSLRWRLNYLAETYPKIRLIPRVQNLEGWNALLDREFGPTTEYPNRTNPLTATETVKRQRVSLDWLLKIVKGEFPRLKIRPHSETEESLRELLADYEVGPLAAEILGYLPSARNQEALSKAVLSPYGPMQVGPNKPPATKVAACEALVRNVDRGGLGIDNS